MSELVPCCSAGSCCCWICVWNDVVEVEGVLARGLVQGKVLFEVVASDVRFCDQQNPAALRFGTPSFWTGKDER